MLMISFISSAMPRFMTDPTALTETATFLSDIRYNLTDAKDKERMDTYREGIQDVKYTENKLDQFYQLLNLSRTEKDGQTLISMITTCMLQKTWHIVKQEVVDVYALSPDTVYQQFLAFSFGLNINFDIIYWAFDDA